MAANNLGFMEYINTPWHVRWISVTSPETGIPTPPILQLYLSDKDLVSKSSMNHWYATHILHSGVRIETKLVQSHLMKHPYHECMHFQVIDTTTSDNSQIYIALRLDKLSTKHCIEDVVVSSEHFDMSKVQWGKELSRSCDPDYVIGPVMDTQREFGEIFGVLREGRFLTVLTVPHEV